MVLLSGECSYKFKFRLVGIERLQVLFNEIQDQVATYNKTTKPRNVTLFNEAEIIQDQTKESKVDKVYKWFSNKMGSNSVNKDDLKDNEYISKYIKKSIQL